MSTRPCGSKTRAKNRFTRKELETLAKSKGISSISSKTMDQLCQELFQEDHVEAPQPIPTQSLLTSPVKEKSPSPKKPTCLIDVNRTCSKTSKDPTRYRLPELRKFWKEQCSSLAEFKGEKPTTIRAFCTLLRRRYARLHFISTEHIPLKTKTYIENWTKKLAQKLLREKSRPVNMVQPMRYMSFSRLGLPNPLPIFLERLYAQPPIRYTRTDVFLLTCPKFDKFDARKASIYARYLYNKNVTQVSTIDAFLQRQTDYIFGLGGDDKYRILGYTYAGDKIVNSFLLGVFQKNSVFSPQFLKVYTKQFLFPLALDFWHYFRNLPGENSLLFILFDDPTQLTPTESLALKSLYREIKLVDDFINSYQCIVKMLNTYGRNFRNDFWYDVIESYITHLTRIINNSPPVPATGLIVYRGVREHNFVNIHPKKNIFINLPFMSTTLDLCKALSSPFFNITRNCCLFVIQALPGSHGLFVSPLSYYTESEILFAPRSQLYVTRTLQKTPNTPFSAMHFALVN